MSSAREKRVRARSRDEGRREESGFNSARRRKTVPWLTRASESCGDLRQTKARWESASSRSARQRSRVSASNMLGNLSSSWACLRRREPKLNRRETDSESMAKAWEYFWWDSESSESTSERVPGKWEGDRTKATAWE